MDYDTIVIGSGFGGSVSACRLAQAGDRVVVLERGRRWDKDNYPLRSGDWVWDQTDPASCNGWLDLRIFKHMAVAQGAAVGGGSLIYANCSIIPPPHTFEKGWPAGIDWSAELAPHYITVGQIMNVQKIPNNQWTRRTKLMKEGADATGAGDRFRRIELAISFNPEWNYDLPDAVDPSNSLEFVNPHGVTQGTCVHLGNCDIGCDVNAKNTLDRNYLKIAENHGADVRPFHLVRSIEQVAGGYRVHYDVIDNGKLLPGSLTAGRVVVAAGSLSSTELMLRCRNLHKTLPNISAFVGKDWSSNGDFLTPAFYQDPPREIEATIGPTISCAIDFLKPPGGPPSFFVEDGGFPNLLAGWIREGEAARPKIKALLKGMRRMLERNGPLDNVMPWFAQGVDAANGVLSLRRRWFGLFGPHQLSLDWQIEKSAPLIEAIIAKHTELSVATGGKAVPPASWTYFKYLITPHPLGGCNMGNSPADGVVDDRGEVFGYKNLHVLDASIIPEAVGVNPSRTIAAVTERAMAKILA